MCTLKGHTGQVYTVAFSPDGKRVASGSSDRLVKIWDAATGSEVGFLWVAPCEARIVFGVQREFIDSKTSMATYSDPLRGFQRVGADML